MPTITCVKCGLKMPLTDDEADSTPTLCIRCADMEDEEQQPPVAVDFKTKKDAPALVRAGERWSFAAYLWKVDDDEWKGKCCWNPIMPDAVAYAMVRRLCAAAGMVRNE